MEYTQICDYATCATNPNQFAMRNASLEYPYLAPSNAHEYTIAMQNAAKPSHKHQALFFAFENRKPHGAGL
jgi:hypothetical protein